MTFFDLKNINSVCRKCKFRSNSSLHSEPSFKKNVGQKYMINEISRSCTLAV